MVPGSLETTLGTKLVSCEEALNFGIIAEILIEKKRIFKHVLKKEMSIFNPIIDDINTRLSGDSYESSRYTLYCQNKIYKVTTGLHRKDSYQTKKKKENDRRDLTWILNNF